LREVGTVKKIGRLDNEIIAGHPILKTCIRLPSEILVDRFCDHEKVKEPGLCPYERYDIFLSLTSVRNWSQSKEARGHRCMKIQGLDRQAKLYRRLSFSNKYST
jgi:hypothetical protein